ncbi:MAG: hypothetical protein GY832_35545 [Chloroflexi bacterium]|nr:hypothetical protein [Chloroflexota bacterium]
MKILVQTILLTVMTLTAVCVQAADCRVYDLYDRGLHDNWLTLRIDASGCVWWHEGAASKENLPIPLFSDTDSCGAMGCSFDSSAIEFVVKDFSDRCDPDNFLIVVHPEAHYAHLDRVLTIVDGVEASRVLRHDSLISAKADELEGAGGEFRKQHDLEFQQLIEKRDRGPVIKLALWSAREGRIFEAVAKTANAPVSPACEVSSNLQFKQYYKDGYWDERFPDSLIADATIPFPFEKDVSPILQFIQPDEDGHWDEGE